MCALRARAQKKMIKISWIKCKISGVKVQKIILAFVSVADFGLIFRCNAIQEDSGGCRSSSIVPSFQRASPWENRWRVWAKPSCNLKMSSQPLLKDKSCSLPIICTTNYPQVYDSFAIAKVHKGFLKGGKVLLPKRIENHMFEEVQEEVRNPTSDAPTLNVGNELVQISSLNHIV